MRNILILAILTLGLISTSVIKNRTRVLEKELSKLNNEIKIFEVNLKEASLDFEYLTTPKNISNLSRSYLDEDFFHYKKSQMHVFDELSGSIEKKENIKMIKKKEFKLTKKEENVDSSHQFKKKNSSKILIDDRLIAKN